MEIIKKEAVSNLSAPSKSLAENGKKELNTEESLRMPKNVTIQRF